MVSAKLLAALIALIVGVLGGTTGGWTAYPTPDPSPGAVDPLLPLPPARPPAVPVALTSDSVQKARSLLARDQLVAMATGRQRLELTHADRWYRMDDPSYGVRLMVTVATPESGRYWLPFLLRFDSRRERALSLPAPAGRPSQRAHLQLRHVSRYWALVDLKHGRVASFLPAYVQGVRPYRLADPRQHAANFR